MELVNKTTCNIRKRKSMKRNKMQKRDLSVPATSILAASFSFFINVKDGFCATEPCLAEDIGAMEV